MNTIDKILCGVVLLLGLICSFLFVKSGNILSDYSNAINNVKALELENSNLKDTCWVIKYKAGQLRISKDADIQALNHTIDSLNIKYKNLLAVLRIVSYLTKTDSLYFRDTIFVNKVNIDTTIGDKQYYNCRLKLRYPNFVEITPYVKSDKHIIFTQTKETINTPSKVFFVRWFQKKQTIIEAIVVENNPYIETLSNKFIQIVK